MTTLMTDLNPQEKAGFDLRALYRAYGYTQYKMSKFEEYDLYVRNKDFLLSDSILTFTDTDGKLLALKPDVTLSIVKNSRALPGKLKKLYYNENVYRISGGSSSFREIMQVGLECIGDVDRFCIAEVISLAAESLSLISEQSLLNLSHLGMLSALLEDLSLPSELQKELLRCVREKNLHELSRLLSDAGVTAAQAEPLTTLLSTYGTPDEVLPRLSALRGSLPAFDHALEELEQTLELLRPLALFSMLRIDFSVTGNLKYYNGIAFCGFVGGIPQSILSGGQYDGLMARMRQNASAIGFAVYLDLLDLLRPERDFDADVFLLYSPDADLSEVMRVRQRLLLEGCSVAAGQSLPEKNRYQRILRLEGSEVIEE